MSGSIVRRHLNKNFELVGVFASAAAYLAFLNKQSAEEGMTYYDTTLNQLRTHDGTTFSPAGQNGVSAGSLDDAANIGTKITIDGALTSGLEIEATDAIISSNGQLLLLDNNDTGSDVHALEITSTSTAPAIQITNTTDTTDDIQGTSDTWAITGQGAATLTAITMGDAEPLNLGASTDAVLQWDATRLALTAAADSVFRIGAAAFSYDVEFIGQSAITNLMKWDLDGGVDSLGALVFDNVDLDFGDNDVLRFGDGADVTMTWNGSNLLIEALSDDTGSIIIGSTNSLDFSIRGSTNTNIALFDVSTAVLEMDGWSINLQDDDFLFFGDSNDVTIRWTSGQLDMLAAADDTLWTIGNGTNSFDIQIFGETAAADIVFDASANKLSLDGIDLKLEDDDYILLGDSATAAGTADGTLRWDSSALVLEIIGNTTFEGATIIIDNDLTVSGVLTLSGSLNPSALSLGDGETLTFGDGSDLVMSATGTTTTMAIASSSSLSITGSGGNEMAIGTSGNLVNLTLSGTLSIGTNDKGYDISFFAENSADLVLWDQDAVSNVGAFKFTGSCAYFTDSSGVGDTAILLGTGSGADGDFSIRGDSSAVLHINQVASGVGTLAIGTDGKGITTTFFGETALAFMKWVQASDQLQLEGGGGTASLALGDGDKILLGDTLGTGDFVISSTSATLTIGQVASGTGTIAMGVDGKGIDQKWFAETTGDFMLWDQDGHSNLGALVFEDSAIQFAGAASTYTYAISTSEMTLTATDAASSVLTFGASGGTHGMDFTLQTITSGDFVKFDAGAKTLVLTDVDLSTADGSTATFDGLTTTTGGLTVGAAFIRGGTGAITTSSTAAAIPVTGSIHEITTDGTGNAMTLINGIAGQRLIIIYVGEGSGGDTAILTPTTLAGGNTITFNTLGDSADLTYSSTGGWYMHGGTAVIA